MRSNKFVALYLLFSAAQTSSNLFSHAGPGVHTILGSSFGTLGANATFDYVIVGGGTAGLTIATRLAEDARISVAVVEAGGFYELDNGNRSIVPGYANFYTGSDPKNYQPLIDWGFVTTPQAGGANRTIHYARGKTLGGSSARNYMIYHRPTKGSLQKWADEVDDQSYTWDEMMPFYRKSCHYTSPNKSLYNGTILDEEPSNFDPQGGPLEVSFSNYADAFGSWAQKAYIACGMKIQNSLNAGFLNGSAYSTLTIDPKNGFRSSSESSFLQTALLNGSTPTIYKNTLGLKVLFHSNNIATGVLVRTAGDYGTAPVNFTISARNEVIISAGAFQSPQLLMVSGIGPKETLNQLGIPSIKDVPGVGQNMWDHILFGANRAVNVLTASASLNSPVVAAKLAAQFLNNGSGPLAAFGAGYYGWERLPDPYRANLLSSTLEVLNTFPSDWPELEWLPISAYLGYQTNRQLEDPRDGRNYASINPGIIAPLSRGTVTITSASMTDHPIIDPAWLTHPADQDLAIAAFKRSRQIWSFLTSQNITATSDEALPGLNVTSDAGILEYISKSFMTIYHAAGTCKMGKESDVMAVVDSKTRVFGIEGLRVVDASAFPFLPPGHPQSTIYALAEKIASEILEGLG